MASLETDAAAAPVAMQRTMMAADERPSAREDAAQSTLDRVWDRLLEWRKAALKATPAFIVNNASNLNGMVHLAAEALTFKAAGITFLKNNRGGEKANILIDPINNIRRAVMGVEGGANGATHNHWQARSTASGMTGWAIGTVTPEAEEDEKRVEADVILRATSPTRYFGKRFVEGFYFFSPHHKRQQIGMGVTAAGLFGIMSGFYNVSVKKNVHFPNIFNSINGAITTAAGLQLWFAPDNATGWTRFGATMWSRLLVLPFTVARKISGGDRWGTYLLGQAGFHAVNTAAFMIGGAEKRPDGTVIDHQALRAEAKLRGKSLPPESDAIVIAREDAPKPATTVSAIEAHAVKIDRADNVIRVS